MSRWLFVEPAFDGHPPVEVYVTNPDGVSVTLASEGYDDSVVISFWQLERLVKKIRAEYAFQLDREEAEQSAGAPPETTDR